MSAPRYAPRCQSAPGHMPVAHREATGICSCPCHIGNHRNPWWRDHRPDGSSVDTPDGAGSVVRASAGPGGIGYLVLLDDGTHGWYAVSELDGRSP